MNNKKHITIGILAVVILVGTGVAYYFDPVAMNNAIGINSAQPDAIASVDLSVADDASSSAQAPDPSMDAAPALPTMTPSSARKSVQKKNNTTGSIVAASGTSTAQAQVSIPATETVAVKNTTSSLPLVATTTPIIPTQYTLTIVLEGNASSVTVMSDPTGLLCGVSCTGRFASGMQITLKPVAGANAAFDGWAGACYGETICSLTITADTSLIAQFHSTVVRSASSEQASSVPDVSMNRSDVAATDVSTTSDDDASTSSLSTSVATSDHILISAVQIAGASSSNDLVMLYNPTAAAIDMSGWKLHKKSQTGTDYSLKEFPAGSVIDAGQFFLWANATGGFSETVDANVSSTETLAANNSVALFDAAENIIDAVAWGTGTSQYGEGPPYPTSPGANQLLSRRSSEGTMADTGNNTNDFIIQ